MHDNIALLPDPTHTEGKGLWSLKRFPGLAHRHQTACAPIRMYANYHMASELAESRTGTNVPRIFPHMCSRVKLIHLSRRVLGNHRYTQASLGKV